MNSKNKSNVDITSIFQEKWLDKYYGIKREKSNY